MKRIAVIVVALLLVFSIGFLSGFFSGYTVSKNKLEVKSDSQATESNIVAPQEEATSPGKNENSEPGKEEQSKPEKDENSLAILKEKLQKKLAECDGEWAVYVENLADGASLEINNKKMVAASLIKLFIMGKTYEETEKGNIPKENVQAYLKPMITISDNEASNILVAMLGGGKYTDMYSDVFQEGLKKVNSYANSIQCADTEQQRDMKNSRPVPVPEENYTSVADCGKLLSKLYHKKLVSESADSEMLGLLKQQTRTGKIPGGLPAGTVCANKTGELSDVENDVAIVFSPGADYVLCVMSNDVPNTGSARQHIVDISQTVYNFFN